LLKILLNQTHFIFSVNFSGATRAAQLAAAAASQINAKLGVASAGPAPPVGVPDTSTLFGIPFGPAQSEVITVPDRMVGLCKLYYL